MAIRDTTLDGVPVRLARISFSGELAFEVYVNPWYAVACGSACSTPAPPTASPRTARKPCTCCARRRATRSSGRTPTARSAPHDLGLAWAVSKKKVDFIGKRSFDRAANHDPLRKQLVGLLPVDRQTVLPEGSQIVEFFADGQLPPPPVPMLGHVTSSYRSAELDRPFALALVKGGRARVGDTVHVPVHGTLVPVEVTGSVLVDPEGARRDG